MSEQQPDHAVTPDVPDVAVESSRWPSVVWLIPIVAAAIGAWLIYTTITEKGPRITITFKTAEGLEAGKTFVKYKEVNVGLVESVRLNEDLSRVIATVDMEKGAGPHLTETTQFWVVVPRLTLRGVSGLGTLVSGSFIEMDPGKGGELKRAYEGLDTPPPVKSDVSGKEFLLTTKRLGSYSQGSPVFYRGIEVGEVLSHDFADDDRTILVHIFVRAPYDLLVSDHTQFWNVSGIEMSLDANGMNLRTMSLQSMLLGGIAFNTPDTVADALPSKAEKRFTLYDSELAFKKVTYTEKARFVAYFQGSVRGLTIGAPVEFRGIKIGEVIDARMEYDSASNDLRIRVLIEIEPERATNLRGDPAETPEERRQRVGALIDRGLRAQLTVGSFLTGQLLVELDLHPDTPVTLTGHAEQYMEIPTIPTDFDQLTTSITELVKKIEKLPLDKLTDGMVRTVDGADRLVNSPELQEAVQGLNATIKSLDSVVKRLDKRVAPETVGLLTDARSTLRSVNSMVSDKSALRYDLASMFRELALAARSIRSLASYLERNPNALIYGKSATDGAKR
jgi:paraquat-inducible protein B